MILKEEDLIDKVVFVNGKRIAADIKELDTVKGYVDILVPSFGKLNTVSAKDASVAESEEATFEYSVRRLQGTVEVRALTVSSRN